MAKKYKNVKKVTNKGDYDIMGIMLIIIASFLLLCLVATPILGDVSRAIKNVILGIFGIVSYPLLIGVIGAGVAMLRRVKIELKASRIVGIVFLSFFAIMILQLVMTSSYMTNFGDYIGKVYSAKYTAGGVMFGVFAFGLQSIFGIVFAYILMSLGVVAMIPIVSGVQFWRDLIAGKLAKPKAHSEPAKESPISGEDATFFKEYEKPAYMQNKPHNRLFVSEIIPTSAPSEEIHESIDSTIDRRKAKQEILSGIDVKAENEKRRKIGSSPENYEKAMKTLFGDSKPPESVSRESLDNYQKANSGLVGSVESEVKLTTRDKSGEIPREKRESMVIPKIMHSANSAPTSLLKEVVMPAPKADREIIPGEIVNGEEFSKNIVTTQQKSGLVTESNLNRVNSASTFDTSHYEPFRVRTNVVSDINYENSAMEQEVIEQEPILRGSEFARQKEEELANTARKEEERANTARKEQLARIAEDKRNMESRSNNFSQIEDDEDEIEEDLSPIINASQFNEPTVESRFEKLLADEKKAKSAFEYIEEVEDKSETGFSVERDFSGYYTPVDEKSHKEKLDEKIEQIENSFSLSSPISGYDTVKSSEAVEQNIKPTVTDKAREDIFTKYKVMPKAQNQLKMDEMEFTPKEDAIAKPAKRHVKYNAPPIEMLEPSPVDYGDFSEDIAEKTVQLETALSNLKIPAKVTEVVRGPSVTRYELEMPIEKSVKSISGLAQDIAYSLACKGTIRMETPIPGKRAVGIEIPNNEISIVGLRDIIDSTQFKKASSPITLALGKDIVGNIITCNLEKMPHLLVAGATNSGKSACLNSIITSIIYKSSPEDVRLILVDPKMVEFSMYKGLPHLLLKGLINEPEHAVNAFTWAIVEMERRYKLLNRYRCQKISDYNQKNEVLSGEIEKLPYIVIIVDELGDLMLSAKKEVEEKIRAISQKARAAGIHLILATQRPSVDVITGTIKANLPSRIAFAVSSNADSRTILNGGGAETLLGRGDMLYLPADANEPVRVQGAWVSNQEILSVVQYAMDNNESEYDPEIDKEIFKTKEEIDTTSDEEADGNDWDPLLPEVLQRFIELNKANTTMIQSRFSVGYARALRIMDQMQDRKFISAFDGSKPREVLITKEEYKEIFGEEIL